MSAMRRHEAHVNGGRAMPGLLVLLLFLAHFIPAAFLQRRTVDWDGIAFLRVSERLYLEDPAHFLYPPLLTAFRISLQPLGATPETATRLVSVTGGSLALVLLSVLLVLRGLPRVSGVLLALLFITTPVVWPQVESIEVYAPTMAAWMGACVMAERFRERPGGTRLLGVLALSLLSVLLHFVSVLLLPYLVVRIWSGLTPRIRHAAALGALLLAVTVALSILLEIGAVSLLWKKTLLYAPALSSERPLAFQLEGHAILIAILVGKGSPVLSLLGGGLVLLALARGQGRELGGDLLLAAPGLLVFGIFGTAYLALLLPSLLFLTLGAARGARLCLDARNGKLLVTLGLGVAVVSQILLTLPEVLDQARRPDPRRAEALRLAELTGEADIVLAGELSQHLLYYSDAPTISLPDLLHGLGLGADPQIVVQTMHAAVAHTGRPKAWLTGEAIAYLARVWGVRAEDLGLAEDTPAAPGALVELPAESRGEDP